MSLGSDSSTILYGTLKTEPIRLDPGELQSQCHQLKQFSYKYHIISNQISA